MEPTTVTTTIPSQATRDSMSQLDHDSIIELKVLVRTVLDELKAFKGQMRDMQIEQATQAAALDARWQVAHNGLEGRVRALEDTKASATPGYQTMLNNWKSLSNDVEALKQGKDRTSGVWGFVRYSIPIILSIASVLIALFLHISVGN